MKKTLFIWIPKNAGTSIYTALSKHGMRKLKFSEDYKEFDNKGSVTFGHVSVPYLLRQGYLDRGYYEKAIKFAVVRNPWDRFVSLFKYFKEHKINVPQDMTFRKFCYKVFRERNNIPPVGEYNRKGLSQCNPQSDWIYSGDRFLPDYLLYYENLDSEFKTLCNRLGVDAPLDRLNSTGQNYKEYYDEETIQVVGEIYKKDIINFNYMYDGV